MKNFAMVLALSALFTLPAFAGEGGFTKQQKAPVHVTIEHPENSWEFWLTLAGVGAAVASVTVPFVIHLRRRRKR